jgi:class 3 adenylate cyclase/tetratricopeptide (TPR) repeat protein
MAQCSECGADLPAGARFCSFCGTPVEARPAIAEERRVVTILFVDLVGFTERSDRADPEDVRRTLVPFHRRVKEDLEAFGGTLDKFIGDAVMGVFGAPVAHEDDPVRAVHAALRILDSLDDLRRLDPDIAVRIAVNTGEAIVSFGAGPQVGEAVAGDVVNTASRMQSLAPRDSVVIGEDSLRAVRDRFEVEALPPATVKGKSEPLQVWRVLAERADVDVDRTPFVGRRRELATLVERFDEVAASASSHAVTVVADAGVGKSRLAAELAMRLADRARWVTGICLPYGEGVTFAPVEQTVRALTGIEPSNDAATAVARLEAHAARIEADPQDRSWLIRTLQSVLALEPAPERAPIAGDEIAQAWARLLAAVAAEQPLLLAIEDLHDAAPAFVAVLAATAELLEASPVLIVATTRPQAALPEPWTALSRASTLRVGALDESEARALLGSVLLGDAVSESERAAVLERSAGNPLYAIEFARMLAEGGAATAGAETPASVQAVISARLDAVPSEIRSLALDASVLGDEVWPRALESLDGGDRHEVRDGLEDLVHRGLLEPRKSSLPGLEAYRFAHGLIREVAYGRLPRAARARRHLAAARWLEAESGERSEEWAESLARHFASAAELAAASNEPDVVEEATGPALRWLVMAGDRAARVDPATALATFERALALAPPESREREEVLGRTGLAGRRSGLLDAHEVLARYEEALAIARKRDDDVAVGDALTRIGTQLAVTGEVERARAALAEAIATLEQLPPGRALAKAYAYRAEEELFAGDTADAMAFADRALTLLEGRLDEVAVMALHIRGDARCSMGDLDAGLEDLEDALRRAEEAGHVTDIVSSRNYLAEWRWATQGPAAGLAEWEQALDLAERRNVHSQGVYTKAAALWPLLEAGEWDRVLAWSDDLLAVPPGRLDPAVSVIAKVTRAHVLLARGGRSEVTDPDELVLVAERTQELAAHAPALVAAAAIALADGELEGAATRLEAFESVTEDVAPEYRAVELVRAVRLCLEAGRPDVAERLVSRGDPKVLRDRLRLETARAMVAEARGEREAAEAYAGVAERLRTYGDPFEEAMALLGHARLTGDEGSQTRARALLGPLGVVLPVE